jgi:hypothetical protein
VVDLLKGIAAVREVARFDADLQKREVHKTQQQQQQQQQEDQFDLISSKVLRPSAKLPGLMRICKSTAAAAAAAAGSVWLKSSYVLRPSAKLPGLMRICQQQHHKHITHPIVIAFHVWYSM